MIIDDFLNNEKSIIDEIETTINNEIMIKLINGKQFHKLKIYKANNILGYKFKVYKTMFNETQNIFDFTLILEKLLNMNITDEFKHKIIKQLESLNMNIITSNGKQIL